MIGISAYFSNINETYLEYAAKQGVKYLFTSLHLPEDQLDVKEAFMSLNTKAATLGLKIIPDISPKTFKTLGLADNDFSGIKKLGIQVLRLDYGFSLDDIISLYSSFELILNSSTLSEDDLIYLIEKGIDVRKIKVMHNFYPKTETGLSKAYFMKMNQLFKQYSMEIMAFVSGDCCNRYPLYEGLPTLEHQRGQNSYISAVELNAAYGIEHIIIGDCEAKIKSISHCIDFFENKTITIPVLLEDTKYFQEGLYQSRRDQSIAQIRLNTERCSGISPCSMLIRHKGAITIENNLAGRYCGEVQIIKRDLAMRKTSNVIGYVHPEYLSLLDYITAQFKIKLVKIEENK